jgi:hypothetical protein
LFPDFYSGKIIEFGLGTWLLTEKLLSPGSFNAKVLEINEIPATEALSGDLEEKWALLVLWLSSLTSKSVVFLCGYQVVKRQSR